MDNFTFTTRETYLAYKAEWKERYAEQSQEQRKLKNNVKIAQREKGWAMNEEYDLKRGKRDANELLAERQASKEAARQQWEAHRNK